MHTSNKAHQEYRAPECEEYIFRNEGTLCTSVNGVPVIDDDYVDDESGNWNF